MQRLKSKTMETFGMDGKSSFVKFCN